MKSQILLKFIKVEGLMYSNVVCKELFLKKQFFLEKEKKVNIFSIECTASMRITEFLEKLQLFAWRKMVTSLG